MRNGLVDAFEMLGIMTSLDKIVKLRRKYDSKDSSIPVTERLSVEFNPHFKTCYVCANGKRAIKYVYGNIRQIAGTIVTGGSLGVIKGPIKFVTTDKTVANHDFVKETSILLKNNLKDIESNMQKASKAKWGLK